MASCGPWSKSILCFLASLYHCGSWWRSCSAWATAGHVTSKLVTVMTHSAIPLPQNARLWLLVQLTERNNHEKCLGNMYNRWFEGSPYFSLLAVETRSGSAQELQLGLLIAPSKLSQLVWGTWLGAVEGSEKFLQGLITKALPAWPVLCVQHNQTALAGTAVLQWLREGRVCWKVSWDCSARREIPGITQHTRHTPCFWNRWS